MRGIWRCCMLVSWPVFPSLNDDLMGADLLCSRLGSVYVNLELVQRANNLSRRCVG